jgi:predicted PurR-regulated permease PerM
MNPASPATPKPESLAATDLVAAPGGHPSLRIRMDARSIGVIILAMIATIWILDWAQSFFVSLLVGILIAYTLSPLVNGLQRLKFPRVVATTVVMIGVLGALVFGTYSLRGQIQTIINQLPTASSKLSAGLASLRHSQRRTMQKMEKAAQVFANATKPVTVTPPPAPPPPQPDPDAQVSSETIVEAAPPAPATPVQIVVEQPSFKLSNYFWAGSVGVVGILGQMVMVIFLVFFLLLTGDIFKRKLVRLAGPSLSAQKITITILDDINQSIQRYMFMLLITNVMVGLATWVTFRMIGLDNAGAWAVLAGVLHLIPYFGPAVTAAITGMAAFIQFDSFLTALVVAGASLAIATVIGTFVATWMTGRIAKMNTAGVFISLLFWGWLWGVWGMLLGIPIIVIIKVVSQQVEQLHPVAELLGE